MTKREDMAAAKAAGLIRYNTGKPCAHGHYADRYTSSGRCSQCTNESTDKWRRENPDLRKAKYRAENARRAERGQLQRNPEKDRQKSARWRSRNRERLSEIHRKAKAKRYADVLEENTWRRSQKLCATPPWADREKIAQVYRLSRRLTAETGVVHHVDHIVPLLGRSVRGLHVHYNLRAVSAEENLRKSNRLIARGD